jgi:hypothetical protein
MISSVSNSITEQCQSRNLQTTAALDTRNNSTELCLRQFCEAGNHNPISTDKLLQPILITKGYSLQFAKILWTSPWSLFAIGIGILGLITGGGVQRTGKIIEFWGGFLPVFLKYFPFVAGSPVSTFGHVVLGRSQRHLDACRQHQLVHVKQYECWGPLFVPAYLTWWYVLRYKGKDSYLDNPFEREAYGHTK